MRSVEDRRRDELPPSGFGMVGPPLFAARPLADILKEKSSERVCELTPYVLAGRPFSQLRVRRGLIRAATFSSSIVLDDEPIVKIRRRLQGLVAYVTVSFTGDPDLFGATMAGLPDRVLKGRIKDDRLVIGVLSPECDELMIPYAIASEIIAVRQVLAAQDAAIADHNREQADERGRFVKDRWESLCLMRPHACSLVQANAERDRQDLLELYDAVFA